MGWISWNVQGGITAADGTHFIQSTIEDLGFRPDVWCLQECGDPARSIPVAASGFEAFGDGRQRGNAILLSSRITSAVVGTGSCDSAYAVAIRLEGSTLTFCSAHLPCSPASLDDFEAALADIPASISLARGVAAGPVLLGCDANAGPAAPLDPVVGDYLLVGSRFAARFQLF